MSIIERTRGEEILIRLNEIGVAGAHYKTITEYVRDGQVLPGATLNAPIPLALVAGTGGPSLPDLLGDLAAQVLLQFEVAVEEVTDLTAKLTTAETQVTELTGQVETLVAKAAQDQLEIDQLDTSLQDALREIDRLKQEYQAAVENAKTPTESEEPDQTA